MHLERTDPVNWSTLKQIGVSPKHYLHLLTNPREDTDALRLGRLTHCMVFEPDKINERYVVSPRFNRAMNDDTAMAKGYDGGKQAAAAWLANVGSREVVEREQYDAGYGMSLAVLNDPVAAPYVSNGWAEHRIEWVTDGIACRGRVDHVNGSLSDLKTTRSLVTCERDAARFGYAGQLAWYYDGCLAAGLTFTSQPVLVFVESVPPYDVLVLRFDEDDLNVGRRVYRRCLDRLAECRRTGIWPGVGGGAVRRVVLPPWADPIMEEMDVVIDGHTVKV